MNYKLNSTGEVAVDQSYYWNEDMKTCPIGAKVQLLGAGGVATHGHYDGDKFWVGWTPLPKRRVTPAQSSLDTSPCSSSQLPRG
jgi:hypothetical protein